MARELGVFKRPDSRFYWMNVTLPSGKRIRQSTGTECREEAETYVAKHTLDAYRAAHFGIKVPRTWQDAVVRYGYRRIHVLLKREPSRRSFYSRSIC